MAVTADIPGIGNVQIQDAATEATLKDILTALKKGNKGGGGGSGGGGSGGGGAGGMAGVMEKAAKKTGNFADEIESTTSVLGDFGRGLSMVGGMFTKGIGMAAGAVTGLATEFMGTSVSMSDFAAQLPIVGGALSGILQVVEGSV